MVYRLEILQKWRTALARLEPQTSGETSPTDSSGHPLSGHRQCAQKVLRYLIARYQNENCWGPFRGSSGGRMSRGVNPPDAAVKTVIAAPAAPHGGRVRTGEQIRPTLEIIREMNDPSRAASDPPAFQFRLITLLAVVTVLSVLLAAVQHGLLATIVVGLLVGGFTLFYALSCTGEDNSR